MLKIFKFCIDKDIFNNETYNALSGNFTVKQIINMIKNTKEILKLDSLKQKL